MADTDKVQDQFDTLGVVPSIEEASELLEEQLKKGERAREEEAKKARKENQEKLFQETTEQFSKDFFEEKQVKEGEKKLVQDRSKIERISDRGFTPGGPLQSMFDIGRGFIDPAFKRRVELARDYNKFIDEKHKERIESLSAEELDEEIKAGGVFGSDTEMRLRLWEETFFDSATFGIVRPSSQIESYGQRIKDLNPVTTATAQVAGELSGFFSMYGVANAARLPVGLAKITQLKRGGKVAESIVRGLGYVPNRIKNLKNLSGGIEAGFRSTGTFQAGVSTATSMILNGAADKTKQLTDKYIRDNQLTSEAWKSEIGHTTEGMIRGYGLSLINAPSNMAMRVVADVAFSGAQQYFQIHTGRQKEWSYEQFATDFALNMMIGEGVLRKFYGITRDQIRQRTRQSKDADYFWNKLEEDSFYNDYKPGQKAMVMEEMTSTAGEFFKMNPLSINNSVRDNIYTVFKTREEQFAKDLRMRSDYGHFYDTTKESIDEDVMGPIRNVFEGFNELGFKAPPLEEQSRIIADPKLFKEHLVNSGVEIIDGPGIKLPPLNIRDFRRVINDIVAEQANPKTGVIKGTSVSRESIDDIFQGVDALIDKIPTQIKREELLPKTDSILKVLQRPEDYNVLSKHLASLYGPLDKNDYIRVYEWIHDPDNLADINNVVKKNRRQGDDVIQDRVLRLAAERMDRSPQERGISFKSRRPDEEGTDFTTAKPIEETSSDDLDDLTDLLVYASRSRENLLDAIPYFMKRFQGNPSEARIAVALKSLGINRSPKEVINSVERVASDIRNVAIDPRDPLVSKIAREYDMVPQRRMTEDQIELLYRAKREQIESADRGVAIPTRIPFGDRDQFQRGAYILDLSDIQKRMIETAGEDSSDKIIRGLKNILNENTKSFNRRYSRKAPGVSANIKLSSKDGNKLVIYGENMPALETEAFAKDMYNLIRGSYNKTPQNYRRSFVFKVPQITKATHVNGFKDIFMARVSSFEDLNNYSLTKDMIVERLRLENPESWVFKNEVAFYMDMDDERIRLAAGPDGEIDFASAIAESAGLKTFPQTFSPSAKRNESEKGAELTGIKDRYPFDLGMHSDEIRSSNIGDTAEWTFGEIYKKVTSRNRSLIDQINSMVPDRAYAEVSGQVFEKADKAIEKADQIAQKNKNIIKRAKDFVFGTDAVKSTGALLKERFDVRADSPNDSLAKVVAQGTFADKHALTGDVLQYLEKTYSDVIENLFPRANFRVKDREKMIVGFNNIFHFAREQEYKRLFEEDGRLKLGIHQELAEEINWSGKNHANYDFAQLRANPDTELTPTVLAGYAKATADPLAFTKLALKLFNIKTDDYLRFATRDNEVFTKIVEPLWLMSAKQKGTFFNLDKLERFKKVSEDVVLGYVQKFRPSLIETHGEDMSVGSELFNTVKGLAKENKLFPPGSRGASKQMQVLKRIEHLETTDFDNLSYVMHSVLGNRNNSEAFDGVIAKMAGDLPFKTIDPDDPDSGRAVVEEATPALRDKEMDVVANAMFGRTNPTSLQLIDMGFEVGINHINNVGAQLRYLFQKNYNFEVAKSLKERHFRIEAAGYKPVHEVKLKMNEVLQSRAIADTPARKLEQIQELMLKEDVARKEYLEFLGHNGGIHYIPSPDELVNLKFQIGELKKAQDDLPADTPDNLAKNLQDNIDQLEQGERDIKHLISIYDGSNVKDSYDKVVNWLKKMKATEKRKKEQGLPFSKDRMDFASSDRIKSIQADADAKAKEFEEELVYSLYGTLDPKEIKRNPLMPLDAKSHNKGNHYINERSKSGNREKVRPLLNSAFTTHINKGFVGMRYELKSPDSAPGFEGLYMQRTGMEGMRQFLFRGSMSPHRDGYDGLKKVQQFYDQTNAWMKRIGLWQPQIMMLNNFVQSSIARNPFSVDAAKGFMSARRIMALKHIPGSSEQKAYQAFDRANLFNKSVGFPEMLDDATQTVTDFLLKGDKLGLVKYMEALNKKTGLDATAARAKAEKDYITFSKANLKKGANLASIPLRYLQETTWAIDEYMRIATARPMQKRFLEYFRKKYREQGVKNWDKRALEDSYRRAADYVNDAMVEYSRIPTPTRRFMNRIFMYPTYRIGTFRLYGKMFVDFTKGAARAFGANPDAKYRVSDDRWKQSMFEMGPMFRFVVGIAAVKALVVATFGGGYGGDLWESMTEYRVRRDEGDGYFNQKMGVLSFGTPLFDLNKYLTRDLRQTMKFNVAAWPRLYWALSINQHPVTGKSLWSADPVSDPALFSAQLGLSLFEWHAPFMPDWRKWTNEDQKLGLKILSTAGLGFYYQTDDPMAARRDYLAALNLSNSPEERNRAYNNFNKRMRHIRNQWQTKRDKELDKLRRAETGVL